MEEYFQIQNLKILNDLIKTGKHGKERISIDDIVIEKAFLYFTFLGVVFGSLKN